MRVYLSYDLSDQEFVAQVRERLIAGGVDVWNPETRLQPGSNWLKETGRALERADAIVFILSKRALRSPYMQKEIDYALTTKRLANRVYPVVTDSAPVPWILREMGVIKSSGSPALTALRLRHKLQKETKNPKTLLQRAAEAKGKRSRFKLSKKALSTAKGTSSRSALKG